MSYSLSVTMHLKGFLIAGAFTLLLTIAVIFAINIDLNNETTNETMNNETIPLENQTDNLQNLQDSTEKQIEHPQNLSVPIQSQNAALDNHFWFYTQTLPLDTQRDPYLITRLEVIDNNFLHGGSYINVIGLVYNIGTRAANNCSLNVILYQGNIIAKENKIMLGSIGRTNYIDVDLKIFYEGKKITSFALTTNHD